MKTDRPRSRVPARRRGCFCAVLFSAAVIISAQQPPQTAAPAQTPPSSQRPPAPQTPPDRPTFRTNVNTVLVDLRVVDKDGKFVADVTKDDFRIYEDDDEQDVSTFSLVNIPIPPRAAAAARPLAVSPDVVSNASADEGRLYLIVLDDLEEETEQKGLYQHHREVTVRAIARDFVEHHLGDNDRAALITTSGRRNMTVQLTNDRQRLLRAIDGFGGGYGQIYYTFNQGGARVRDNLHSVMTSLTSVAQWLAQINGRRKAIVLVSDRLGRSIAGGIDPVLAAGEAADVLAFAEAAARGNVSLYAIDPVGQPTGKKGNIRTLPLDDYAWLDLDRSQSLEVISEKTGGFAVTHTNDYATAFDRVVEENSSYYLLGYTPSNSQHDGTFRKIRVEVTRADGATSVGRFPSLHVHARSGYAAEKPPAARSTAAAAEVLPPDLSELVKSPVSVAGLTLSVVATPFRGAGSKASVAIVVEARPSALLLANPDAGFSGAMEVAIVVGDRDGKILGGERGSLTMNLSPATRDKVAAQGVRLLSHIDLPPGEFHLSVAVGRDQARGSVRYDGTVPDFSKRLAMSGLAIASLETAGAPTNGTDTRWKESLRMPATTVREFYITDELRAFVEVYDNDKGRDHQLRVNTTVRAGSGKAVFERQQPLALTKDQTTYPVVTAIPLASVPTGSYVLVVEAVNSAIPKQPVSRQIPFTVRPSRPTADIEVGR